MRRHHHDWSKLDRRDMDLLRRLQASATSAEKKAWTRRALRRFGGR